LSLRKPFRNSQKTQFVGKSEYQKGEKGRIYEIWNADCAESPEFSGFLKL